jgi:hypothetical protein
MREPSTRPPHPDRPLLAESLLRVIERDEVLRPRVSDVCVHVDQHSCPCIAADELDQVLLDILRIAFSYSNVHRVDVYSSRRPDEVCVRVAAESAAQPELPRVRITGRTDVSCDALTLPRWPDACSATWFDNGLEFIYQVRIKRR